MPTQVYYSEIVNLIVIFVNKYNRLKAIYDHDRRLPVWWAIAIGLAHHGGPSSDGAMAHHPRLMRGHSALPNA
jgi:hypothetical protein